MAELTPPVLNLTPRGLLSFFGLKNGGRNPQRLAEFVQPTWDMGQWYRETNETSFLVGPVAGAGVGDGDFLAVGLYVAQGAVQWCNRYTVRALVPAATTWSVAPAIQIRVAGGSRQSVLVGPPVKHTGGAAQELVIAGSSGPFIAPSDSVYGFVVTSYTGAGPVPVYGVASIVNLVG